MAPPPDRHDFPNCKGCPYVNPGQWTIGVPCAAEQLSSIKDPCPICAQERRDGHCHNRLCTRPASSRHFEGRICYEHAVGQPHVNQIECGERHPPQGLSAVGMQ